MLPVDVLTRSSEQTIPRVKTSSSSNSHNNLNRNSNSNSSRSMTSPIGPRGPTQLVHPLPNQVNPPTAPRPFSLSPKVPTFVPIGPISPWVSVSISSIAIDSLFGVLNVMKSATTAAFQRSSLVVFWLSPLAFLTNESSYSCMATMRKR